MIIKIKAILSLDTIKYFVFFEHYQCYPWGTKQNPLYSSDGLQYSKRTAVADLLRCCATNRKVAGSIPAGVIGFFIEIKSFRSHYGPGVDSASNRNEYQYYFLRVKAAGA